MAIKNNKGRSVRQASTNRSQRTTKKNQNQKQRSKAKTGSGGFEMMSMVRWPRIIALIAVMSLAGGYLVWRSQAASGFKSVVTCGADVDKALANTACVDTSAEAAIYRLYAGGLKRQPDVSGFKHWSLELASGASLETVSATFIRQSVGEPKTVNVTLSNGDFVIRMYEKLLGRTPSLTSGGGKWWLDQLNGGKTQDTILASFIATNEVQTKHPGITLASAKSKMGLTTKESSMTFVKDLYKYMNNQVGTQAEWDYWNNEITSGKRTRANVLAFFAQVQTAKNYHRSGFIAYAKANTSQIQQTQQEIESKRSATTQPRGGGTGGTTGQGGSGSTGSTGGTGGTTNNTAGTGSTTNTGNTGTSQGPNPHICNTPYPTLRAGDKNASNNRKDECVSAVQFNLKKVTSSVDVNGTIDGASVQAIRNFQAFFGQQVTGTLTPEQIKSIADIWGAYKTSGSVTQGGGGSGGGSGGGGSGYMDITFVADNDVSQAQLDSLVTRLRDRLSSLAPFSSYKNNIAYHVVPSSGQQLCSTQTIQSSAGPFTAIYCGSAVQEAIAKAGVPADKVFFVSGRVSRAHVSDSAAKIGPMEDSWVMAHELGHLFDLADEYKSYPDGSWGELNLQTYGQCITATASSNTAPLEDGSWVNTSGSWSIWRNLSGVNWHKGCGDSRWYRPAADSLMMGYRMREYNSVSAKIIEDRVKAFTN